MGGYVCVCVYRYRSERSICKLINIFILFIQPYGPLIDSCIYLKIFWAFVRMLVDGTKMPAIRQSIIIIITKYAIDDGC